MSLLLLWLFKLKVHNCLNSINLIPYTEEQKMEICIERILKEERKYGGNTRR